MSRDSQELPSPGTSGPMLHLEGVNAMGQWLSGAPPPGLKALSSVPALWNRPLGWASFLHISWLFSLELFEHLGGKQRRVSWKNIRIFLARSPLSSLL